MITKEALSEANARLKAMAIKGKDYVQVNERVKAFRSICPDGSIVTEIVSMADETVVIKATVMDGDKVLATGLAYEKESSSYINKTSYIENCETSAVGRALGFVGIGIDGSVCSYEEAANAMKQQETKLAQKKEALTLLCRQHNVNLSAWLQQISRTWETLTETDVDKMLDAIRQKYKNEEVKE